MKTDKEIRWSWSAPYRHSNSSILTGDIYLESSWFSMCISPRRNTSSEIANIKPFPRPLRFSTTLSVRPGRVASQLNDNATIAPTGTISVHRLIQQVLTSCGKYNQQGFQACQSLGYVLLERIPIHPIRVIVIGHLLSYTVRGHLNDTDHKKPEPQAE